MIKEIEICLSKKEKKAQIQSPFKLKSCKLVNMTVKMDYEQLM